MTVSAPIPAGVVGPIDGQSLTAKSLTEATWPPVPQANCRPHTLSEFAPILRVMQGVLEANFAVLSEVRATPKLCRICDKVWEADRAMPISQRD